MRVKRVRIGALVSVDSVRHFVAPSGKDAESEEAQEHANSSSLALYA
jgi:hypothetical protein